MYVDEEGYISSRTLSKARKKLSWEEFDEKYGDLEDALLAWEDTACEHEYMELVSERVGNIMAMAILREYIEEADESSFPILSNMFPEYNEGLFPAKFAQAALDEISVLELMVKKYHSYSLFVVEKNNWSCIASNQDWYIEPHASLNNEVVAEFVVKSNGKEFRASCFKQKMIGEKDYYGNPIIWC